VGLIGATTLSFTGTGPGDVAFAGTTLTGAATFNPTTADANLGAEKLWPFYQKCCDLDVPILVHDTASDRDGHPNPALVGIEQLYLEVDNNALPFLLGFPFRYIVDMGSLILRGALKEFPKLRICFVEGSAAFVPWLMDRLDMDPAAKKKLGKRPREFFSQIWVSAFAAEESLKYACDFWKDHNLTVGSDYPHGDPSATWNSKPRPRALNSSEPSGFQTSSR